MVNGPVSGNELQQAERDELRGHAPQPAGERLREQHDAWVIADEWRHWPADTLPADLSWATDRLNFAALIRDLDDRGELAGWKPSDYAALLESPHRFHREYERMQLENRDAA